jgi:hypothetical protein
MGGAKHFRRSFPFGPYNSRMRRFIFAVALIASSAPVPAAAWGFEVHRFIMDRAIALLPADLRPVFEKNRFMVVERVVDPDTWRTAGFGEEGKHHFLNVDWPGYGPYPFGELPRDYKAALAKFGKERIDANGTLPWRVEEYHDRLRRAFESYGRRGVSGRFDLLFFSAVLAHYVSDAHVPFHAVLNHDGQLTGQQGIHERFESSLFGRYRERLVAAPAAIAPIRNPRDFIFDALIEGTRLVPQILKADLDAIGTRDVYDAAYFDALFTSNRRVLERRLNESIAASAAMIAGAWEAAGGPAAPVDPPLLPVQRRRR